jgi:PncC family amidohydrolase
MKKLSQKIVKLLKRKRLKLSVVESCTGGMLSSALTSVSGSSKIFTLGLVTYSNQSKNHVLKVPKQIIRKHGAVSKQCCLSMINNLSKISKSNIAVSITGIAGPSGGSKQKPVGLVYVGIKKGNKIKIHKYLFKNKGRSYIQKATVKKSLGLILNILK